MTQEYQFEVYRKHRGRKTIADMMITLAPTGMIRISPAAFDAMGSPHWVELLFDTTLKVIGIRAARDQRHPPEHAYEVHQPFVGKMRFIRSKAFVSHYDLDYGRTRQLAVIVENGVLCAPTRVPDVH